MSTNYTRILDLERLVIHRSLFLFGPRQTGKSTLLERLFRQAKFYNLLEADTFRELSARPELIRQRLTPQDKLIIIDEIQKLPSLLDEVHLLISKNSDLRFILTGSSARKLKRGNANMLGGRAWECHMHPLVSKEVGDNRLSSRLNRGSLPSIIDTRFPKDDLNAYVGTYLQEEIKAEGLSRNIENFSRFMEVAALTNTQLVNFTAVGNDAGIPPRTIREYYQILVDTLIGYLLPPYQQTTKRKPIATAKFYYFDIGVANTLSKKGEILEGSNEYGPALEHQVFLELKAYLDYRRIDKQLTFWRTESKIEVDFVIGNEIAIEVKAKSAVSKKDCQGLIALSEETRLQRKIVVAGERARRQTEEGIEIIPVQDFFSDLWKGVIC